MRGKRQLLSPVVGTSHLAMAGSSVDHSRVTVTEPVRLLEREHQLDALGESLGQVARDRRGRIALVAGEAGAGKTELLRHFCEDAGRRARVLWGSCDALFTPRPLGPLLDIAEATGDPLREQVRAGAAAHDVALALLGELGGPSPAVVVLEDAHWSDEATLDVVRLVARRIETAPALVVLSFRDEQVGRSAPLRVLLGELPRNDRSTRIDVPVLSPEGVAELAESARVDPADLYARTGGNPFFVTEVLAAPPTQRIPETVRDAVLARAARLGPSTRAVLDAVSIVPQRTELWLLEALTDGTTGGLEECLAAGILRADGAVVAFRHELARLAVEDSLSPDACVALHRRALAALEGRELARLAHHAEAAGDVAGVLRFAAAAGEEAASLNAHREAAAQYSRALRAASGVDPAERADLLERFAHECYLTDMRAEGIDALAEAAEIHRTRGDLHRAAEAHLLRACPLSCAGRTAEAAAATETAMAILLEVGSEAELARAYAELSANAMIADDHAGAIELGRRAIEMAERAGATETVIRALNNVGTSELLAGHDPSAASLHRSIALARAAGDAPSVGRGYINLVAGLAQHRLWARAEPYIAEGLAFSQEKGLDAWANCLQGAQAAAALAYGRYDEAAASAGAVLDIGWADHANSRLEPLCILALVRARRGDPEVWLLLDEAQALAAQDGSLQYHAVVAPARAEAAWLEGRPDVVERETSDAWGLALGARNAWLASEVACWRRRAAGPVDVPGWATGTPFGLELDGRPREAADAWRALGMPYEAALALSDYDDEPSLRRAHEDLLALGAVRAAAILARKLRAGGARSVRRGPRPRTREHVAGLTQREAEVLALVAEGLRNTEISERLVLSRKTVDHHVSAVLRKLGVPNRAAAGAAARRLGLADEQPVR